MSKIPSCYNVLCGFTYRSVILHNELCFPLITSVLGICIARLCSFDHKLYTVQWWHNPKALCCFFFIASECKSCLPLLPNRQHIFICCIYLAISLVYVVCTLRGERLRHHGNTHIHACMHQYIKGMYSTWVAMNQPKIIPFLSCFAVTAGFGVYPVYKLCAHSVKWTCLLCVIVHTQFRSALLH